MSLLHTPARRARATVALVAVAGLFAATPAMSATPDGDDVPSAPTVGSAAVPDGLRLLDTKISLLGTHTWYEQVLGGYPVVGGLYAVHATTVAGTDRVQVWDGRVVAGPLASTDATVAVDAAITAAVAHTGGTALTYVAPSLWVVPGTTSHLAWRVTTMTDDGQVAASHLTYVDARTGAVIKSEVESKSDEAGDEGDWVTGEARVFDPNPVAKLQDQDLTDQDDSDAAVPKKGYSTRPLRNLDRSHTLVGKWARVVNDDLASSEDDRYFYKRHAEEFEQVMAYYGLDTQQMYYRELGFTDVNAEAQKIETNTITADNSFYSPSQDLITMGSGGVDDAEDPEVTWHEAGHATQDDQVPGFGAGLEAGSIGEAYGDYIAVTLSQQFAEDTDEVPAWCVMDWDATSYSAGPIHCLRTTEADKHYPEDLEGEVHADGEIWSQALWTMNKSLGRDKATTAIVEAQFSFNPNVTMEQAAKITIDTTKDLYGKKAAKKAKKAFKARGLA